MIEGKFKVYSFIKGHWAVWANQRVSEFRFEWSLIKKTLLLLLLPPPCYRVFGVRVYIGFWGLGFIWGLGV